MPDKNTPRGQNAQFLMLTLEVHKHIKLLDRNHTIWMI